MSARGVGARPIFLFNFNFSISSAVFCYLSWSGQASFLAIFLFPLPSFLSFFLSFLTTAKPCSSSVCLCVCYRPLERERRDERERPAEETKKKDRPSQFIQSLTLTLPSGHFTFFNCADFTFSGF